MTSSPPSVRRGAQRPRIETVPLFHTTAADDAVDLAAAAGLNLFPWQEYVLRGSLGERVDHRWSAFLTCLVVPRQNGKNALIEARELAGVLLFGEKQVTHTAHEYDTANKAMIALMNRIRERPDLGEYVLGYESPEQENRDINGFRTANQPGIYLKNGNQIIYKTRSGSAGRGFTGELVVLDEAFALTASQMGALLPTLAATSVAGDPQVWVTSSAGMPESTYLAGLRADALAGGSTGRVAYYEWSAEIDKDVAHEDIDLLGRDLWYQANPSLGHLISEEYVLDEHNTLAKSDEGREEFLRERLGVWAKLGGESYIPDAHWAACRDEEVIAAVINGEVFEQKLERVALGVDIPPDRSYASICAAGFREDGSQFVELIDRREGTDWLAAALREHMGESRVPVLADGRSGVGSLAQELRQHRVRVIYPTTDIYRRACGHFYDRVKDHTIRHKADPDLDKAVAGAVPSSTRDKLWAWTSRSVDVSPLVAATLAVHGSNTRPVTTEKARRRGSFVR